MENSGSESTFQGKYDHFDFSCYFKLCLWAGITDQTTDAWLYWDTLKHQVYSGTKEDMGQYEEWPNRGGHAETSTGSQARQNKASTLTQTPFLC